MISKCGGWGDTYLKLKNVTDIEGLFKVIDECKGRVDIITDDMILNLKSNLAKYFALAQVFSDGAIGSMEIIAFNPEDNAKLLNFMMRGATK